jgi:hypothetical protein
MGCRGSRGSRRQVEFLAINLTKRKEVGVQESKGITFADLIVSKRHLPFQMEHSYFKHVRHRTPKCCSFSIVHSDN